MYVKPDVTRYTGTELLDLMGPVETGYCDIEVVEEGPCQKLMLVSLPAGSDINDVEDLLGWRIIPDDDSVCEEDEGEAPEPPGCFGAFGAEGNDIGVGLDVCCLADCAPPELEQWTLELTLFFENGSETTCDVTMDVGEPEADETP
jgi:hypothetical protein